MPTSLTKEANVSSLTLAHQQIKHRKDRYLTQLPKLKTEIRVLSPYCCLQTQVIQLQRGTFKQCWNHCMEESLVELLKPWGTGGSDQETSIQNSFLHPHHREGEHYSDNSIM